MPYWVEKVGFQSRSLRHILPISYCFKSNNSRTWRDDPLIGPLRVQQAAIDLEGYTRPFINRQRFPATPPGGTPPNWAKRPALPSNTIQHER